MAGRDEPLRFTLAVARHPGVTWKPCAAVGREACCAAGHEGADGGTAQPESTSSSLRGVPGVVAYGPDSQKQFGRRLLSANFWKIQNPVTLVRQGHGLHHRGVGAEMSGDAGRASPRAPT